MFNDHKPGCWLRNGGPSCTCNSRPGGRRLPVAAAVGPATGVPDAMAHMIEQQYQSVHSSKERGGNMLNKLMSFDARGGNSLEDAMILAAFGRQLAGEYDLLKVEKPENFDEKLDEVRRFVADTQRADRKRKLADLTARRTQYLSANEKREMLDKQIAELEALSQ